MPVNFPRFGTFDYGNVLSNVESIKNMRLRNQVLGQEAEEHRNILANRQQAREIRAQIDGMPDQIAELEARGLVDEAAELRDSYIRSRTAGINMLGAMRDSIDETNYKDVREQLINAGAIDGAMMPVDYSDAWFRERIQEERSSLSRLTRQWGSEGRVMAQDLVTRDGDVIWEGDPYETTESVRARTGGQGDDDGPYTMEAADTNSIRSAATDLFGGFYNPVSGRYEGLDDPELAQAAAISEEASRIYADAQGQIPHSRAVAEAARKLGIQIPRLENPEDPLGIFGQPAAR